MTLLSELLQIPARVHQGDYVLKLTEGVDHPAETLHDYVITEQLARCFDEALGLIHNALDSRTSRGTFLHGSFGAGKSHFMAVLHLLLQHDRATRARAELAPVIAKHAWLSGKRFLLVPLHMLGAESFEAALFGGYAARVRTLHPGSPPPAIYRDEPIFQSADALRASLGDDKFFAELKGVARGAGWGKLAEAWTAATYEAARHAPPGDEKRRLLLQALLASPWFAHLRGALGDGSYVPLDEGLAELSRHAKDLGHDGLVLFLDELILWLASHIADMGFLNREGQKLAKLVEATAAARPIPIVSFVARQRDLRELVGEHVPGAERLQFSDQLKFATGRFHTIRLEDRNLPAIIEKRVLRPKGEAASAQIDEAFAATRKVRREIWETLLTSTADEQMFRKVYPFSPALVQALVAVSSALQRERTAIKVLVQILSEQRTSLKLGELVPVGALWDAIADGDEPFSPGLKEHFENCRKLWSHKLLPMLEQEKGMRREQLLELPESDVRRQDFLASERILKTLLVAVIAEKVEALKDLTAGKLAALNHGSIREVIPNDAPRQVLQKLQAWAAHVGEIRIQPKAQNPIVTLQVTSVDTESILKQAEGIDSIGMRRGKVRELLSERLGIDRRHELHTVVALAWRGTSRGVEIVFGNLRDRSDLVDASLRAEDGTVKVILDFPFDQGHSPHDDLQRVHEYRDHHEPTATICWLPSFLSPELQQDLRRLVILDHVLAGERLHDYSTHLSPQDRSMARALLENQQSQLRNKLGQALDAAFGLNQVPAGWLEPGFERHDQIQALDPGVVLQPPAGPSMADALRQLVDQLLSARYPAHPRFEGEVLRDKDLRLALETVRAAIQSGEPNSFVEKEKRAAVRAIVEPLQLATLRESHLVVGDSWKNWFVQRAAKSAGPVTVGDVRGWLETPERRGMPEKLGNLVILSLADQLGRQLFYRGAPWRGGIDDLPGEVELREVQLPAAGVYDEAIRRAGGIFGATVSGPRTVAHCDDLVEQVQRIAQEHLRACRELVGELQTRARAFGITAEAPRLASAAAMQQLVEQLMRTEGHALIQLLARADLPAPPEVLGKSMRSAAQVTATLRGEPWALFDSLRNLRDERRTQGQAVLRGVEEALSENELVRELAPELARHRAAALALLTLSKTGPAVPQPPSPPPPPPGRRIISRGEKSGLRANQLGDVFEELRTNLAQEPDRRATLRWEIDAPERGG